MTATATASDMAETAVDDEITHLICCRTDDPGDVALCGTDVAGANFVVPGVVLRTCAMCALIDGEYFARHDNCDPHGVGRCPLMAVAS